MCSVKSCQHNTKSQQQQHTNKHVTHQCRIITSLPHQIKATRFVCHTRKKHPNKSHKQYQSKSQQVMRVGRQGRQGSKCVVVGREAVVPAQKVGKAGWEGCAGRGRQCKNAVPQVQRPNHPAQAKPCIRAALGGIPVRPWAPKNVCVKNRQE